MGRIEKSQGKSQLHSLAWSVAWVSGAIISGFAPLAAKAAEPGAQTAIPAVWQRATPADQNQIWEFILNSPLGIAALNQLAIEGFINPTCQKTLYTHAEYGSFQSLLQVECPTHRGISTARSYGEMRVTFNRFEDTILDFKVERIYEDDEADLPSTVAQAIVQTAAQQLEVEPATLQVIQAEERTWTDGCFGLGGPAELCLAALVEGWRVVISDGDQNWVFRTNAEGNQARLEEAVSTP
ncbi:hypothetical protein [Pseudanabaena sp. FACHB-2040]|uniref:hypothetical protein n=1 Tax=Pseudanabaena sp. FACHB-2040 TaxID=2692859 RepID=UPI00168A0EDB|nr:hypothetical protein [Pseudanabaena sp. FACHB-2040]MBD2256442.1 hypothetical protein [Pseudanabaena sp. FACHB-2040]